MIVYVLSLRHAQIAQLVEQWTENPRVTGSIPVLGTFFMPQKRSSDHISVHACMRQNMSI